jgi:hypothetical protein
MHDRGSNIQSFPLLSGRFQLALRVLIDAHESAEDVGRDPWDFAVEIQNLRELGLTTTEFRWLSCKGLVLHQQEVSDSRENKRRFKSEGVLHFSRSSCFVVTDEGLAYSQSEHFAELDHQANASALTIHQTPTRHDSLPVFDNCQRELTFLGKLVKRFKLPSPNQETVLIAFEEDGWPNRIDDPLPPRNEQDPKQRLHDTIKCLNRRQINSLIRFKGDGTGKGVLWRVV